MANHLVYHMDAMTAYEYARTTYKNRAAGERSEFYRMQLDVQGSDGADETR